MKQYEGTLRLDLSRRGRVYKRVEQKNTVTALVQDTFLDGNFGYLLGRDNTTIMDYFDGCLLTDKQNNANLCMIAGDSEVVAQAGNDTYTGLNFKRGSYIPLESTTFTEPSLGFTKIWRWDNAYGNGVINSVCLAPHEVAIFDYVENALPIDGNPPNKPLGYSSISASSADVVTEFGSSNSHLNIIDYDTGKGYYVCVSRDCTTVYIDEFEVSTSTIRILGSADHVVRQIGSRHSIIVPTAFPTPSRFGDYTTTICYTGDAIHIISFSNYTESSVAKVKILDYKVLISNLDEFVNPSPTPLIYSDLWLYPFPSSSDAANNLELIKDGFVYNDTDKLLWGIGKEGGSDGTPSMLCFDLTSTNVEAYDISFAPPIRHTDENGYLQTACILLDNGDFYKFFRANNTLPNFYSYYYHNDKVYAVSPLTRMSSNWKLQAVNGGKNTIISNINDTNINLTTPATRLITQLDILYPYVSTVANLPEEIRKTYEFDMTLSYSIREATST